MRVCREPEVQVLDFCTQQMKLFPLLATAYAFCIVGNNLVDRHTRMMANIDCGRIEGLQEVSVVTNYFTRAFPNTVLYYPAFICCSIMPSWQA